MTQQTRLGLIAVGIVAGLAMTTAIAVFLLTREQTTGWIPTVALSDESKLLRSVAQHPFWKRKPSESEVLALAERIRTQPKNEWLHIDENGKAAVVQAGDPTPGLSHRQFIIVGERRFKVRPTVPEVLAVLKKELDEHEYD